MAPSSVLYPLGNNNQEDKLELMNHLHSTFLVDISYIQAPQYCLCTFLQDRLKEMLYQADTCVQLGINLPSSLQQDSGELHPGYSSGQNYSPYPAWSDCIDYMSSQEYRVYMMLYWYHQEMGCRFQEDMDC